MNKKEAPRAKNPGDFLPSTGELGPPVPESPAFRGSSLSPGDYPLQPGQFLSTLPLLDSASLEVTDVGDLVLRAGDLPAFPQAVTAATAAEEGEEEEEEESSTLWAHRASGFGGEANGGLGCVLESWWRKKINGEAADIPAHLSVKNGRWRVGRGGLCTMVRSPRPQGGWRAHLPWDARGRAIRAATLRILDSKALVVASGDEVVWSSVPEMLEAGQEKAAKGGRVNLDSDWLTIAV